MAKKGVHGSSLWSFAEEHLTCSICYNLFDTPKTLACLHSFCENCLLRCHDGYSEEIMCPVCRQADSTTFGDVENITTDFKLVNMVESVRKEDKQAAPFCSEHDEKLCRVYCQTCEELLCLNCLAESDDHREHVLEEVREVVAGKRQAVKDHVPKYQAFTEEIVAAMKKTEKVQQDFNSALDKTRKEVQEKAEKEIAKVNAAKNKLLDEIQQIQSKRKERFAENELELTVMRNTSQEIIDHSTDAMQESNDYDFLKRYSKLSNDFQYLTNSSLPIIDANASFLKFDPHDCCESFGSVLTEHNKTYHFCQRPATIPHQFHTYQAPRGWQMQSPQGSFPGVQGCRSMRPAHYGVQMQTPQGSFR